MRKEKLYKKITLLLAGVLVTELVHLQVTSLRGYKAIGGEFLLVPLAIVMYAIGQAVSDRWKATNEHFNRKQQATRWKEEGRQYYAK